MKTFQKIGGVAALIGAATNLLALVVLLTILAPTGYGSDDRPGGGFSCEQPGIHTRMVPNHLFGLRREHDLPGTGAL